MRQHAWVNSTLGHGDMMCRHCFITNREAEAIGTLELCDYQPLERTPKEGPPNEPDM